jgi:DNA-binding CsgD family transcriptional regulator
VAKKRSRLLLPPEFELVSDPSIASPAAVRLAKLSSELLGAQMHAPSKDRLIFGYQVRLAEKGYASVSLQVRQESWRQELEAFWEPILSVPSINSIFKLGKRLQFPACMVRGQAIQHHPLKHLLMIGALFESVSDFIDYCQCADVMHKSLIRRYKKVSNQSSELAGLVYQQKSLALLRKGKSLRQTAQALGGSVTTLKMIAIRHGIDINRRPHKLFATERRAIWRQLVIGTQAQEIAENIGCSVGAVEQELRYYPEIKDLRRKIRYYRKRHEHRAKLIHTMMSLTLASRGQVQSKARASYTWLFKHDKQWLYQQLPQAIIRKSS